MISILIARRSDAIARSVADDCTGLATCLRSLREDLEGAAPRRVALYARYSSDMQNPTSVDDQFQLAERYAAREGWGRRAFLRQSHPRPGDLIVIGADSFTIQGEPIRDRERLIWTLDLRPS